MAKCRISNLTPPCGYNVQGVVAAAVLDFEDFGGFQFVGDGLEDTAQVDKIFGGDPIALPVSNGTKYTSARSNKIYTHTLETFIPKLSAQLNASLDLATRRKFVVMFTTGDGGRFVFGYENGASLTYTSQTADASGSMVSLSAASIYPLFELSDNALVGVPLVTFDIDFNYAAFCETRL